MGADEKLALIYAGQPLPPQGTASVFLAGPTPRSADVQSWRPAAIGEIAARWPPDCPNPERNRYLIWLAHRHGVPVTETLDETVAAALAIVVRGD
jgi:hypothetical protein